MHRLTREQARRIAVQAQLLGADRPAALLPMVERLTLLQLDPVSAVAPSADLVAWSRLGAAYRPADLTRALETDRTLTELIALVHPTEQLPVHLGYDAWGASAGPQKWLATNDSFRRDLLARLEDDGPLLSRDLPDTCVVPWASTGWTGNKNVTRMLELMVMRGEVAVSGRRGRQRVFDVASRIYPPGTAPLPDGERVSRGNALRLQRLGIARSSGTATPGATSFVGDAGEPAVVEDVPGEWRVDPAQVAALDRPFTGRTALLSPFDRLVHDRRRALELFEFDYRPGDVQAGCAAPVGLLRAAGAAPRPAGRQGRRHR